MLLLHGWPYDIHSYAEVVPPLAAAGYRVLVPYLRGYGATRFRSDHAMRNGQQSVLAVDAIALLDALGVDQAVVATADHAIHPNAERDMAKRAGSEITEIDASHAVPATHPADVAAVIVRAVKAVR